MSNRLYAIESMRLNLCDWIYAIDSKLLTLLFDHMQADDTQSDLEQLERKLSDIDIAVLFDNTLAKKEAFDLQLKLIVDLGDLLKTNNVDLVVLNDFPLLLAFNIIRDGVILKSDERIRVHFETRIMSRYYDEQYYIKRHMKRAIERMAKGRLG